MANEPHGWKTVRRYGDYRMLQKQALSPGRGVVIRCERMPRVFNVGTPSAGEPSGDTLAQFKQRTARNARLQNSRLDCEADIPAAKRAAKAGKRWRG